MHIKSKIIAKRAICINLKSYLRQGEDIKLYIRDMFFCSGFAEKTPFWILSGGDVREKESRGVRSSRYYSNQPPSGQIASVFSFITAAQMLHRLVRVELSKYTHQKLSLGWNFKTQSYKKKSTKVWFSRVIIQPFIVTGWKTYKSWCQVMYLKYIFVLRNKLCLK